MTNTAQGPFQSIELNARVRRARQILVCLAGNSSDLELSITLDHILKVPGVLSAKVEPAQGQDLGTIAAWHTNPLVNAWRAFKQRL